VPNPNSFLQSPFQTLIDEQPKPLPGSEAVKEIDAPDLSAAPADAPAAPAPTPRAPANPQSLLPPAELRPMFEGVAAHFKVPVNILMAVAQQESSYNPEAVNKETGAAGIGQYIDATAKSLRINPKDPNEAVPAIAQQLRERLDKGYSLEDAVKEHFAGPDRKKWGEKTAAYGQEVLGKAGIIGQELYGDAPDASPEAPAAPQPKVDKPVDLSTLPITPEYMSALRAQWDGATPEQRQQLAQRKDYMGVVAREMNRKQPAAAPEAGPLSILAPLNQNQQQKVQATLGTEALDRGDPRAEARARRLVRDGMNGADAISVARDAARRGVMPGQEAGAGQNVEAGTFDFDTKHKFESDPVYSNPVMRAAVKGYEGYKQGVLGINQFAGELLGADVSGQKALADESRRTTEAIGDPHSYGQKMFEGAVSSIAQQLPALIGGAATGSEVLPLASMFMQSFGQEYGEGRAKGQDQQQATARAALYGTFEVIGEKFGLGDKLKGLRGAVTGASTEDVAASMAKALLKEIPGEELTTLGQFGTDKLGGGVGLNTEAGLADYLQQAADTAVQTIVQGGIMGSGATGVSHVANRIANTPERQMARAIQQQVDGGQFATPADAVARAALDPNQGVDPASTRMPVEPSGPALAPQESQQNQVVEGAATPNNAAPGPVFQADDEGFTGQILGDDGQVHTIDSRTGVTMADEPAAPAGPLEAALQAAAEQHAADPAPAPVMSAPEPAAPDYTAMPLEDLKARLKQVAGSEQSTPEQRLAVRAERQTIEKEMAARAKQAVADSKPAEEALVPGPFEDMKQANAMMLRYAEKTGQPHEVVGTAGHFVIQPVGGKPYGIDSAGAGRGSDGHGRGGEPAAGMGRSDGAPTGEAGRGTDGAGRAGKSGVDAGIVPDAGADRTGADGAGHADPAVSTDHKANPYHAYAFPDAARAEAFMDKKAVDREKFEAVQTGPVRWQVKPRAAQAQTTVESKEQTADVPQRQEVPEEAPTARGEEAAPEAAAETGAAGARADSRSSIQREMEEPTSWVIRNKETGETIMETRDPKKVAALNTAKYEAVPTLQHLQELNDSNSKARRAEPTPAAKEAPAKPKRKVSQRELTNAKQEEVVKAAAEKLAARKAEKEAAQPAAEPEKPKTRDTRNTGVRFHGTSRPLPDAGPNNEYAMSGDNRNIYGQGFYTTDAADISEGYMRKGRGGSPTLYEIKERGEPKLYDMEQPMTPEVRAMAERVMGDEFPEQDIDGKPINTLRELFDEYRDESKSNGLTRDEVQEVFDAIRYNLEQDGYHGYRHIGGLKTDKAPHDVRIYWTPEDHLSVEKSDLSKYQGEEQPQPAVVEQAPAPTEAAEVEHNGTRIYRLKMKQGDEVVQRWAVETPENRERRANGQRAIGGDSIHEDLDAAKKAADLERKQEEQAKAREHEAAEAKAAADRDEAERKADTYGGFLTGKAPNQQELARKALAKQYRFDGQVMTVRERVDSLHAAGDLEVSTIEDPKIKPLSRAAFNRASQREQDAHEKKMREAGTKTTYLVNGSELGKTAYDYASHLLSKKAAPKAEKPAEESEGVRYSSAKFSEDNRLSNLSPTGASWERIREANPELRSVTSMDQEVTVYRATIGDSIRPDDYVALNKKTLAAELRNVRARDKSANIISAKVRVRDLLMANDATEFVYYPDAPKYSTAHPMAADSLASVDPLIQSLADAGVVVLHDDASTLPGGRAPLGVQALTEKDGTIHLVASSLTDANARAVLLHETFHSGGQNLVGSKVWGDLMQRLGSLYRQGEATSGAARAFWDKARARVETAKAKGAVAAGMEHEEFGAYAIEEYASAPATVRKWVDDLVGAVKAWALRRFGRQLGQVTPAQLSSLAKAALLDVANTRAQEAYSVDGTSSATTEFADQMRAKYPGLRLDLMDMRNGALHLSRVVVPMDQREQGTGTAFMNDLIRFADEQGRRITLTPSSDFGGNKARLSKFYKRFGFVENKGRNKDFSTMESMYRDPQGDAAPRYSVAAPAQAAQRTLTPEEQGILRRVQGQVQDNLNRVKQVQEKIAKITGTPVAGGADYYGAETNRPGRIASRKEDGRNKLFEPMLRRLADAGYTPDQLEELLHAQHAEERNEAVAKINPEFADGGSGMKTAEAHRIMARYQNEPKLLAIADEARQIARETLDMKKAYGLITDAQHDSLSIAYDNYVPLKGDGEYGPKVKRAMGHGDREEHILENIARDFEQAIVVGEKNLARQSLVQMILQYPDDSLWTARVPPKGRYVAGTVFEISLVGTRNVEASFTSQAQVAAWLEAKGAAAAGYEVNTSGGERVVEFTKPLQDNEVMVYVKGSPVRLQIQDEALARQLRPLRMEQMGVLLAQTRKMIRWMSIAYTGYNPYFIPRNAVRDLMTGSINMAGNHGVATMAKAWIKYPAAWGTMFKFAAFDSAGNGKMGQYLKEYRSMGGKTGASYMSDLDEQGKTLQRMFDDAKGAIAYAQEGKVGKAALIAGRKAVMVLAHTVEVLNQAFENALRLALFAQLREEGAKPAAAAQAAKNVTVNFDRKGASTNVLGAMYLFLNPAIQGTANMTKTLAKGEHKFQAWGLIAGVIGAGVFAALHGMDDDKDRWLGEKWETRTKNFRMRVGSSTITVPVSQEYAPFYAAGVAIGEMKRGQSGARAAVNLLSSFLDAYYPMQGAFQPDSDNPAADFLLAHVPTVAKLPVQVAMNRNSFGNKIVPETENTKNRPDNLKMARRTKNGVFDKVAQGIAGAGEAIGYGDKYENDLSKVSPETLRLVWQTYTGGLGRFITDTGSLAGLMLDDPSQVEKVDIPFATDFYKPDNMNPIRARYFDLAREAGKAIDQFEAAKKQRDADEAKHILADPDKKAAISLAKMLASTNKVEGQFADRAVEINADKTLTPAQKRAQLKAIEDQQENIYRKAIGAFKK
jgi:hypothetical protein